MPSGITSFNGERFDESFSTILDYATSDPDRLLWVQGPLAPATRQQQYRARTVRIAELTDITTTDGQNLPIGEYPEERVSAQFTYEDWSITCPGRPKILTPARPFGGANPRLQGPSQSYHALTGPLVCETFGELATTESQLAIATRGLARWCHERPKMNMPEQERVSVRSALARLIAKSVYISDYESPPQKFMDTLSDFGDWQSTVQIVADRTLATIVTQDASWSHFDQKRISQYSPSAAAQAATVLYNTGLLTRQFWAREGIKKGGAVVSDDFLHTLHGLLVRPNSSIDIASLSRSDMCDYAYNLLRSYRPDSTRNKTEVRQLQHIVTAIPDERSIALSRIIEEAEYRKLRRNTYLFPSRWERIAPALFGLLAHTWSRDKKIRDEQREQDRLHCEIIASVINKLTNKGPLIVDRVTGLYYAPPPTLPPENERPRLFMLRDAGLYAGLLKTLHPRETQGSWLRILEADLKNASSLRLGTRKSTLRFPGMGREGDRLPGENPGYLEEKRSYTPLLDTDEGRSSLLDSYAVHADTVTDKEKLLLDVIIQEGKEARQKLIDQNVLLVFKIAVVLQKVKNIRWDDRIAAGYEGLCRAVDGYDVKAGYTFSTYASHMIGGAILKASLGQYSDYLGVGKGFAAGILQMLKTESILLQELSSRPSNAQLARRMKVKLSTVEKYKQILENSSTISLDNPPSSANKGHKAINRGKGAVDSTAHHLVAVEDTIEIVDDSRDYMSGQMLQAFEEAGLTPTETRVVSALFGIPPYSEALSEAEAAEHLGQSRSKVAIAYMAAMQKLQATPALAEIFRRNLRP